MAKFFETFEVIESDGAWIRGPQPVDMPGRGLVTAMVDACAPATRLALDGGTLDLGIIRDSDLVSTNDYRTFVETFEGVAKVGLEVLEVSSTTAVGPYVEPAPVTP